MDYRTLRKLAIVFGLVIHAQAEEFLVGTTLKLPCNVPESFSKFTWDKSATLIAEVKEGSPAVAADPRVSVDTNENLGELSIRNILEHDAGDYFCTVEFSDRLPQTTRYTVYIVDSTSKPPSPTTSTRVAQSSTVSTDSASTSKPPSTTSSTRVAVSSTVSTDSEGICCCPCSTLPKDLAEEAEKMNLNILAYNERFTSMWENYCRDRIGSNRRTIKLR
eukprot:XP_011435864.1 PREDICTED: uncharacterized protein LOC105334198 isoform X4 [Crassostrea gigas]